MESKAFRKMVRQGDLLFKPVKVETGDYDRFNLRRYKHTGKTILVRGEATGHSHRVTDGQATILGPNDAARPGWLSELLLEVEQAATVSHEEHAPVTLLPGLWEVVRANEFDYAAGEARRVVD